MSISGVCLPNSMAHLGNNITVQSRSLKQVPPPRPGFNFQCFQPMDSNGGSKKGLAERWSMMRGDVRCKSTPGFTDRSSQLCALYFIHAGCIWPFGPSGSNSLFKRFGKPMQIPCWRRHVLWSAQTLYTSMMMHDGDFSCIWTFSHSLVGGFFLPSIPLGCL